MKTKPCMGCQRVVSTWASKCPGCGRSSPTMSAKEKVIGIAAITGFIAVCVSVASGSHSNSIASAEHPASATPSKEPASKSELDPLDVLPSRAGELKIKSAWRVSTEAIGIYEWPSVGTDVTMTCALPPPYGDQCDSSAPLRLRLGGAAACADPRDESGQGPGRTGPFIMWPTCFLSVTHAGTDAPKHFKKMKDAAVAAAAWTERVVAFSSGAANMDAVTENRNAGLLAATRVGNVQRNLNISHQLDLNQ